MQTGSVLRSGRGWRGYWRERGPDGKWKRRATKIHERKGDARAALNRELDRLRLGAAYRAPITFDELCERFLGQHDGKESTRSVLRVRLRRPREVFGVSQASDVTTEALQRLLNGLDVKQSYRHSVLRAVRGVYNFGVRARLVDENPARHVRTRQPDRGENIIVFESWEEIEHVADECGPRWSAMVVMMADTGARPGEIVALEHRHVDGDRVFLPGAKTAGSRRVVHMTERGVAAYRSVPRSITTPLVFHGARGGPVSWQNWRWDVWYPALRLAGLSQRPPYALRHTFAVMSLRAGVPIHDLARELGHADVSRTYRTYAAWVDEMGPRAANLRETWARGTDAARQPEETRL